MENISIKVNLKQLKHVEREMTGKDGVTKIKCLIIPITENMIFEGEKGAYLNMTAIEIKDRSNMSATQKDTHLIKQDIPKDKYELMTDEERKNTVSNIVGSMKGIAGERKNEIINRQLCHFFRVNVDLGRAVAHGLGIEIDQNGMQH